MIFTNLESLMIFISLYSLFIATILFFIKNSIFNTIVIQKWANTLILLANISMMVLLTNRWLISNHFPLSNLYESTIFLAWSLTFIYLFFQKTNKNDWLGIIIAPVAMFTYSFAILGLPQEMQKMDFLIPALQSYWLMMHVSMMIISYATLLCGSLLSMTWLVINKNQLFKIESENLLFNKSVGVIFLKNSNESFLEVQTTPLVSLLFKKKASELLTQLDYWGFKTISVGFPCLTIGIMSGAVWANEAWGSYWNWDPKETWALITWLIFAIYLHSRIITNWTREISAMIASSGFFIIWICYLGVNLLGRGLHSYGWFVK